MSNGDASVATRYASQKLSLPNNNPEQLSSQNFPTECVQTFIDNSNQISRPNAAENHCLKDRYLTRIVKNPSKSSVSVTENSKPLGGVQCQIRESLLAASSGQLAKTNNSADCMEAKNQPKQLISQMIIDSNSPNDSTRAISTTTVVGDSSEINEGSVGGNGLPKLQNQLGQHLSASEVSQSQHLSARSASTCGSLNIYVCKSLDDKRGSKTGKASNDM